MNWSTFPLSICHVSFLVLLVIFVLIQPSCFLFYMRLCLHLHISLPLPPSPLTFALVEPEAQTHFSFSIFFFLNNDIISKNCWGGKGLRAVSGFDNARLLHFSLSLSLIGPYLAAAAWFLVKLLCRMVKRSLWFDVFCFLCTSPHQNTAGETQGEEEEEDEELSFPLRPPVLLHSLSFCPLLSLIPLWLSSCLSCRLSSPLSLLSSTSPSFSLLSPSPSPWFCRGRVEVISRCVTLAMCRQWMGLWQGLGSLSPQWQRRAGEGNNYTHTWDDLRLFTKWEKWDSGYFIYCFIFSLLDLWPSRWMRTRCLWFGWTRWRSERRVKLRPRGASHGETLYRGSLCTAGHKDWLCR